MSRLVMLSDATGVRAYDGLAPGVVLAGRQRGDYTACKDAAERANTVQTRHLTALRRIITASPLVPYDTSCAVSVPGQTPASGSYLLDVPAVATGPHGAPRPN